MKSKSIILGTRGSKLALIQTEKVRDMLKNAVQGLTVEIKKIKTEGDKDLKTPLSDFGGRGAFVRSIERALLRGEIDAAVHSLKDLPSQLPEGLTLGATPERIDPRDVLIADHYSIDTLPTGSIIATGSDRRRVQLKKIRPDIMFTGIRGNIETRLKKYENDAIDAVILAAAGLDRLGLNSRISQYFDPEVVVPAPCQGALGIECRSDDDEILSLTKNIENMNVRVCVDAERSFIGSLGLGCHAPVGSYARIDSGEVEFTGFVYSDLDDRCITETIRTDREDVKLAASDLGKKFRLFFIEL
ncbi:MAG: hydroxymethylbilane synthase [Candidatus Latescibacteria bacterium]|nr:hydroxymethylbilane synthase [Candidatus Latescibacterota bacterium]